MSRQAFPDELTMLVESNRGANEHDESAHRAAAEAWEYLMEADELTEEVVRGTHAMLMSPSDLRNPLALKYQGFYRRIPIQLGGRMGLDYTRVPISMDAWIEAMNGALPDVVQSEIDKAPEEWRLVVETWCRALHVEYEKIHPFVDGNGRTGRMFYNWHRLKHGLPVHVIYALDRRDYYQWFEEEVE